MRGGLSLCFDGIGLTVVLLTLTPQLCEAGTAAALSNYFFDMPWPVAFANGFTLAAVSPAVLLQSVMKLIAGKIGVKKGIPSIMLIASSFDDIVAITVFSIFVSITFDSIRDPNLMPEGSAAAKKKTVKEMIGMNVFYFVTGIAFGSLAGASMSIFNKCDKYGKKGFFSAIKFIIMVFLAVALPIACHHTKFEESKYIGIIFFGYFCFRSWGDNKPEAELSMFWNLC